MRVAGPYEPMTPRTVREDPPRGPMPTFDAVTPLGGVAPEPSGKEQPRPVRHLVLAVVLLVTAIVAAWSSTMPWRDQVWHRPNGPVPTGWTRDGEVLGRGWITMALAVLVASSGLLITISRERLGRIIAVTSGIALMALATIEWGVAGVSDLDGPGRGLWVQLLTGVVIVLAVGIVTPLDHGAGRSGPGPSRVPPSPGRNR